MTFDGEGNVYVPLGTPSDACQGMVDSPGGKPGGSGVTACSDLEKNDGVSKFKADKPGQTPTENN
jgi:hypothetical protein